MKSRILIGTSANVRYAIADTTNLSIEAINVNKNSKILCTSELALLNIAALLSGNIKSEKGKITLLLKADGILGKAKARARKDGRIIATNEIETDKLKELNACTEFSDFAKMYKIGKGQLIIETDLGLKKPYYTTIDVNDDKDIEQAIQEYYLKSEQVDTIIKTGVKYDENSDLIRSGAIFIQALPECKKEIFEKFKKKLKEIYGIQDLLAHDMSLEDIAKLLFDNIEAYKNLEIRDLVFKCDCSYNYCLNLLKRIYTLDEIRDIIKKDGYVETVCGFCNAAYRIDNIEKI